MCDKPKLYHTGNMLYQTLPARNTFDTIPLFDTSMALLSRSIDTLAFVNNKQIFLESIESCKRKVSEL